jgi:inositol transport system ATP-binding protein
MSALDVAPLCPAGHLPHLGGDWTAALISPITGVEGDAMSLELPISPPVGEMPGRAEGGVVERDLSRLSPYGVPPCTS